MTKPRKPKPREFWAVVYCDGAAQDLFNTKAGAVQFEKVWPGGEIVKVREVPRAK